MDMSWFSKFSLNKFSVTEQPEYIIQDEQPDNRVDYLRLGYTFHPDWQKVYSYCLENTYRKQELISPECHHNRRYFYSYHHERIRADAEDEAKQIVFNELRYNRLHEVFEDWGL